MFERSGRRGPFAAIGVLLGLALVSVAQADWEARDEVLASDDTAHGLSGHAVSIRGDYAMAGALRTDDNGTGSGTARVFARDGAVGVSAVPMAGCPADDRGD